MNVAERSFMLNVKGTLAVLSSDRYALSIVRPAG